jgi:two-component system, chemotaxis family, response regulator Rcp1
MNANGSKRERHLDILLIENDPATAALTREVMKEVGLHDSVTSVRDGDEALAFLQAEENQGCRTDVIFLDLHLPKMSGLDVLREIKTNPAWVATPVVVVSGVSDPAEIRKAYELHASCYIHKPSDLDEFLRFMRVCYDFWGGVVTLPNEARR